MWINGVVAGVKSKPTTLPSVIVLDFEKVFLLACQHLISTKEKQISRILIIASTTANIWHLEDKKER